MKGEKIGEDKYNEHWSLDGHSYVEVPKWVVERVREECKEAVRKTHSPASLPPFGVRRIDAMDSIEALTPPITNNKN